MQLDEKAYNFIRNAKEAGATLDQVATFLKQKGYDFQYTPTEETKGPTEIQPQEQQERTEPAPGLIQGSTRQFATGATAGLAPYIAGATNTIARRAGALAAGVLDRDLSQLRRAFLPTSEETQQYMKEGKEEYIRSQEAFKKEHPIASTLGEATGTLAGIALTGGTVGAATKAGVAATRLGQAGRIGSIAARTAGEAATFGTYDAVREGFESGEFDAMAALKGGAKGAGLGVAFGVMGGGMEAMEPTLVKKATEMIGNPKASKLLVTSLGIGVEGATIGALPSALEGEMPTAGDIGTGLAFEAGGRGVAKAGTWLGKEAYNFANKPTKMQIEEMRARAEELKKAEEKLDNAVAEEIAATRERRTLERQYKDISINEPISSIKSDLDSFSDIDELLRTLPNNQARGILDEVVKDERIVKLVEEAVPIKERINKRRGDKGFWEYLGSEEGKADREVFGKIAKEISDTELQIAKDKVRRNILKESKPAGLKTKEEVIKEAKETEDMYAGERKKAEEELGELIEGKQKEKDIKISATDEEIADYMKANSKNPNMTPEKARLAVETSKKIASQRFKHSDSLPLKERILRSAKELTSKTMQQFNWLRPVEEGVLASEAVTGEKVAADKNPVYTLNKLRNGGEQEALIRPVVDTVQSIEKKYPGSVDGARSYLEAARKIQKIKADGNVPAEELTSIIEMYKGDAPVQEIVKSVYDLNKKVLNRLYESGRIDKTTYEAWKKNDAYVPSWVEKYDEAGEQIVMNQNESYLKKYKGEADVYQNPILSSLTQSKRIDQFAEMQKAKKQYIELAKKTGQATKSKTLEDYKGGKIDFNKDNQIVVWEEGKPQIWNVPKRVAGYFNPAPVPSYGKVAKFFQKLAAMPIKTFKGATTAASLGFAESNIPRDVSGALFGSEYGGNISASMIASSTKELINREPIVGALRKELGAQTLRDVEQLPWVAEDNVQRFVDMFSAIDKSTTPGTAPNVITKLFSIALPNYARKVGRVSKRGGKSALETLSYAGNLSEETTRLSVFKSVLQGMAKDDAQYMKWVKHPDLIPSNVLAKAGNEAREVTLNFNRQMAPWVEMANKYFLPYFKPALLGAMRGMTMLSNPNIAPRAWRYIINMGIMQGLIKGEIVDGKQLEDLDAINNEISGKTLILRGENNRLYTIPLGQELAPFVSMFAGATEKMYRNATKQQREDIGREITTSARQMLENYAPVYGYIMTPSNFALGGPIPKFVIEEMGNVDLYTRTPIVPKSQQSKPDYMQQTKNTPALAIQLSKTFARHGWNVSPMRIRHFAVTFGSNVAKEGFAASDAIMREFGLGPLRPAKDVTDSPYTRRLIADVTAPYNQYSQDANEIIDAAKKGHKAYEEGYEEDWSEKQKNEYQMQDDIYSDIEDDIKSLQESYKIRSDVEKDYAEDAYSLKKLYREKKISRKEYKQKWQKLEEELKQFEEEQTLEERFYQLAIIKAAKDVKEEYKKAPK